MPFFPVDEPVVADQATLGVFLARAGPSCGEVLTFVVLLTESQCLQRTVLRVLLQIDDEVRRLLSSYPHQWRATAWVPGAGEKTPSWFVHRVRVFSLREQGKVQRRLLDELERQCPAGLADNLRLHADVATLLEALEARVRRHLDFLDDQVGGGYLDGCWLMIPLEHR